MRAKSFELVILKPTAVFLSFLAAQLPEARFPDLRLMQIDNTAYAIPNSNDEPLVAIEKHFSIMLHHELSRWVGDGLGYNLKLEFFDFLCCFKFELYNHIILMEPSLEQGKQLLLFKPRVELLNWLEAMAEQEDMTDVVEEVRLANIQDNATILIKNFANLMEIKPFIKNHYQPIFSTAMSCISNQSSQWPGMDSFQDFSKYFTVEIHTQLIHL